MNKILLICGPKLGDVVVRTPIMEILKKENYVVYVLQDYWNNAGKWYLKKFNLIEPNKIIDFNSRSKFFILKFLLKNIKKFDYIFCCSPTTKKLKLFADLLLPKKIFYSFCIDFKNTNVIEEDKKNLSILLNKKLNYKLSDFKYIIDNHKFDINEEIESFKNYIIIFPGMKHRSLNEKTWNDVIKHLKKKYDKIVLIGGKDTLWLNIKNNSNIIDLRNKISLEESIYLIKNSNLNILSNSGLMWLSILMNKRTIAFHGPSKYIWEYKSDNITNIRIWNYEKCVRKPCENKCIFGDFRCIRSLRFDDIKKYLEGI